MAELFGAVLTGGMTISPEQNPDDGTIINSMWTCIVDPAASSGHDTATRAAAAEALAEYVRASPSPDPDAGNGAGPIVLPGDVERDTAARRSADGIPLPAGTVEELQRTAAMLGVPPLHLGPS